MGSNDNLEIDKDTVSIKEADEPPIGVVVGSDVQIEGDGL